MKKINVFWASMAGAGVLLLVLVVFLVLPAMSAKDKKARELATLKRELDAMAAETPGKPDIEGWKKYRDEARRAYADITKFYADSDKALERWFPGMENPNRGNFMTKVKDEGARLEAELVKKGCAIGVEDVDPNDNSVKKRLGFNWEALDIPHWSAITQAGAEEEQKVLRELQKRFWARQRVANLVLNGGVKISRLADFRFFKRLHPSVNNPPWESAPPQKDGIVYSGLDAGGGYRAFQEFDLPNGLGKTLTFGAALELPYAEVPKALREILNPGGQASEAMLISLVGAHVTIRGQNDPLVKFKFKLGDAKEEAEKRAEALKPYQEPRDVLLTVTCQIVDFDPSQVKSFDGASGQ